MGLFLPLLNSNMDYKLYTLVDITHSGQIRHEVGREKEKCQEQNFNTVLQILGLRSNISFVNKPQMTEVGGRILGFDTDDIIRVWRFDWSTEQDLYSVNDDPVGFLKEDFYLVPYISGLDEMMTQTYPVFSTQDPGKNIVFHVKN